MTLYVDSSALLKRYVDEADSETATDLMASDPVLVTSRLTEIDTIVCVDAARIAEQTLCRSLDAIHLASARRAGVATAVLTFDLRQALAARSVGLHVLGA